MATNESKVEVASHKNWDLWVVLALATLFYAPQIGGMIQKWENDPDYTHAFLVIPIAIGLLWWKRSELAHIRPNGHWIGLPILLAGLLLCIASLPGMYDYPGRLAIIPILIGSVLLLRGRQFLKKVLFPIVFLFFMVPIPNIMYSKLAMPLQLLASDCSVRTLNNIGIPVEQDRGNQMILKNVKNPEDKDLPLEEQRPFTMEVAQACSGIRSLLAMTCLAAVMVYVLRKELWSRITIFLLSIAVAILLNVFRVATTGVLVDLVDPSMAGGRSHEIWGLITFALAFLLLLGISRLIDWITVPIDQPLQEQREATG